MLIGLVATWLKRLGFVCLAFVILWHLTHLGVPRRGRAKVHVKWPGDVVVKIDQRDYAVRSATDTPVECDLDPGPHVVQVWRGGHLKGQESFVVGSGRTAVIGPLERSSTRVRRASVSKAPNLGFAPGEGLAARIRTTEPADPTE